MTQNQYMGALRAIVPAGVAWLVGKGLIDAGTAGDLGAGILAVAAALWSIVTNIEGSK